MCTFAASNGGPAVQLPHRAREAEPEFARADKVVQGTGLSNLVHLTDLQFCCPNPIRPLGYPNRSRLPREHGPAGLDQGGRSGGRSGGQGCSDQYPGQLCPHEQTLVRPPWPGAAAGPLVLRCWPRRCTQGLIVWLIVLYFGLITRVNHVYICVHRVNFGSTGLTLNAIS